MNVIGPPIKKRSQQDIGASFAFSFPRFKIGLLIDLDLDLDTPSCQFAQCLQTCGANLTNREVFSSCRLLAEVFPSLNHSFSPRFANRLQQTGGPLESCTLSYRPTSRHTATLQITSIFPSRDSHHSILCGSTTLPLTFVNRVLLH